jgi:biotin carboxyl carrier protein
MEYITKIGEEEFIIKIDRDGEILVNGHRFEIDFQSSPEGNVFSMLLNNRSLEGMVEQRDDKWEVLIRGELYEVQVQDERSYRLAKARGSVTAVTGDVTIRSPMPGIIIAVPVAEGELVKKGDQVIILESMKMENELRAPRDGLISRVFVQPGASVDKEQTLILISDPES